MNTTPIEFMALSELIGKPIASTEIVDDMLYYSYSDDNQEGLGTIPIYTLCNYAKNVAFDKYHIEISSWKTNPTKDKSYGTPRWENNQNTPYWVASAGLMYTTALTEYEAIMKSFIQVYAKGKQ